MIESSCHCGAVHLRVEADPPEAVTDCNCSICRRYGVLWAYYSPRQVRIDPPQGATETYIWGDHTAAAPAAASPIGPRSTATTTAWASMSG